MLLIMVGNMVSIFTQVYIEKVTPIYSFFPHLLHTVPFTSFSLLWAHVDVFMVIFICSCHRPYVQWGFCLPFTGWKSSNQSHCNLKSKVRISIFPFGLPCWSLSVQNVSIHYAGVHKRPEDVLPCCTEKWSTSYFMHIWSWSSTPFMYLLYSWTIQEACITMSIQFNYDHEKFWGEIRWTSKNKKIK